MSTDYGTCPACDKPRLNGQFFVPEFDGLQIIHVKCAKKLGWKDAEGTGVTHFDPETGELVPLNAADEAAALAEPDTAPAGTGGPQCLVRAPQGLTCISGVREDGSNFSVHFKNGAPQWVDESDAVLCCRIGALIEDRK